MLEMPELYLQASPAHAMDDMPWKIRHLTEVAIESGDAVSAFASA